MANENKKHYKTLLKLLATTATGTSLSNKLSDLSIDTEDPKLQQAAKSLADLVRPKIGDKDLKVNILELAQRYKSSSGPGHLQRGEAIEKLKKYCETMLLSIQPEWQLIATKQGWTPPSTK